MIRIHCEFDESVKAVWRGIEACAPVSVFQTLGWCESAWEAMLRREAGNRLWIVVWTGCEDEVPVLMPTFLDRYGSLRFINDVHSDFCDAVYVPRVNKHFAYKEIAEFLHCRREVKEVVLQKLRASSELLAYLGVFLKGALVYRDLFYSFVDVSGGGDFVESQRHLRVKDRQRLRHVAKELSGDTLEVVSRAGGREFPLDRVMEMRNYMVRMKWRGDGFLDDAFVDFARRIYDLGLCEVVILSDGATDLAVALHLRDGGTERCWVVTYRDPKWNTARLIKYFNSPSINGIGTVDLGVGAYAYKLGNFRPWLGCTFTLRLGKGVLRRIYSVLRMLWRLRRLAR